jgi:hypothetical protein
MRKQGTPKSVRNLRIGLVELVLATRGAEFLHTGEESPLAPDRSVAALTIEMTS